MATKAKGTRYAEGTGVSMAKSREEIERLLTRYGATSFMYGTDANTAAIAFEMRGRRIRRQMGASQEPLRSEAAPSPSRLLARVWSARFCCHHASGTVSPDLTVVSSGAAHVT